MTLYWLAFALKVAAATTAVFVTWKRPEHRAVAAFLVGSTSVDMMRRALVGWVIAPARAAMRAAGLDPTVTPFTGWVRIACDLDGALVLTWTAGLAALAVWVFLKRRPWVVLAVWTLASVGLVVAYPAVRGESLRQVYLAAELASLATAIGAFVSWLRQREPRELHHTVLIFILCVEIATLLAPWREGIFARWNLAQAMYAALFAALAVLQGGSRWIRSQHTS